jgi:hypothetical protein
MDTRKVLPDDDIKRAIAITREENKLQHILEMFELIKNPPYDYHASVKRIADLSDNYGDRNTQLILKALITLHDPTLDKSGNKRELEKAKLDLEAVVKSGDSVHDAKFALRTLGKMYEGELIEDIYGLPGIVRAIDLYTFSKELGDRFDYVKEPEDVKRVDDIVRKAKDYGIPASKEVMQELEKCFGEIADKKNYNEFDKLCAWALDQTKANQFRRNALILLLLAKYHRGSQNQDHHY